MKYSLLPYSQLVFDTTRWVSGVYTFPVTAVVRGGAEQKERIETAVRTALTNHPVFSANVDMRGRQYPGSRKDILHGQYHDVDIYTRGDDLYIYMSGSRILGDSRSAAILVEDFTRAYSGLTLEQDDYWGYVASFERHKSSERYLNSRAWLVREFADNDVPVRPRMDRRCLLTVFPPKAGLYTADYTDMQADIQAFTLAHHLSADGFFSLCAALAIARYCGTDSAALTWAYEGRETTAEQRIYGSLHKDIPFQISLKSTTDSTRPATREQLIKETRNKIRSGIAHSDYPYTLTRPYTKRWNYAVNVLHFDEREDPLDTLPFPIELLPLPPQKYAYALLDIEIHEHRHDMSIVFRYSATHYKAESIRRYADLMREYVKWLLYGD